MDAIAEYCRQDAEMSMWWHYVVVPWLAARARKVRSVHVRFVEDGILPLGLHDDQSWDAPPRRK